MTCDRCKCQFEPSEAVAHAAQVGEVRYTVCPGCAIKLLSFLEYGLTQREANERSAYQKGYLTAIQDATKALADHGEAMTKIWTI